MFNVLSGLPQSPYIILTYLAQNNENLWKMLKYNSYDALSKPNLTFDEKMKLVWKSGKQDDYSVFFTPLVEDEISVSKCILKIYDYYIHASPSAYVSTPIFSFDFLYGGNMSLVEYDGIPVSRGDLFINEILKTLNGTNIGGIGTLIFDDDISRYIAAKSVIGNSKTFTGVTIYMATRMGNTIEGACDA